MPEYLAPGVYVEETSYRAKSIEGVSTSTTGFVGACRFGPVEGTPVLVTSFEEYQRYFGDDADLLIGGVPTVNHMARAVQLFFENGGARVYIARIFGLGGNPPADFIATSPAILTSAGPVSISARFPGLAGNVRIRIQAVRSGNLCVSQGGQFTLTGVRPGDVVEVSASVKQRLVAPAGASGPGEALSSVPTDLAAVSFDQTGRPTLTSAGGSVTLSATTIVQKIALTLTVEPNGDGSTGSRVDQIAGLSPHPDSELFVGRVLRTADPLNGITPPADNSNRIFLSLPAPLPDIPAARADFAGTLLRALIDGAAFTLAGGSDGATPGLFEYRGGGTGDSATGLEALAEIDDIAIVAAPGSAALETEDERQSVRDALITHCELLKYRFAVLAAERTADPAVIREARADHDSKYAALYHPWLVVPNASPSAPRDVVTLSPEGAICGIYARSDISRGVHKAPANEVVRGALRFSTAITKGVQDVLNPEGINCLRSFEGRGNLVWGARTISSDPEWIYVNVRRLFIYLEHSIDRGTQWAVFEPNNEQLWLKIRLTIEAFLYDSWRSGALMGTKPEQAYFVRCDRTTMSQNDLDNGRLVCLIGVAPTKPAEFVIFRIGQWTAEASII